MTNGWFEEYKAGKYHGWMDLIDKIKSYDKEPKCPAKVDPK